MRHTEKTLKELEEISQTRYAITLLAFFDAEIDELDKVSNAESWEDALGRKHAVDILRKIAVHFRKKDGASRRKTDYV